MKEWKNIQCTTSLLSPLNSLLIFFYIIEVFFFYRIWIFWEFLEWSYEQHGHNPAGRKVWSNSNYMFCWQYTFKNCKRRRKWPKYYFNVSCLWKTGKHREFSSCITNSLTRVLKWFLSDRTRTSICSIFVIVYRYNWLKNSFKKLNVTIIFIVI